MSERDEIEREAIKQARDYYSLPKSYEASALAPETAMFKRGVEFAARRERERWEQCFVPCPRTRPSPRTKSTAHDPVTCPHGCFAGWLIDETKFAAAIRGGDDGSV